MIHFPPQLSDPNSSVGFVHFSLFDRLGIEASTLVNEIYLPMPEDIKNPSTISWNAGGLSVLRNAIDTDGDIAYGKALYDVAERAGGDFKKHSLGLLIGSGTSTLDDAHAYSTRRIKNPYLSAMFRGIDFRDLTVEYTFVPMDERESDTILQIVKEFRKYAVSPGSGGDELTYLKYPGEFEVEFLKATGGVNEYFPKYKRMVLAAIESVSSSGIETAMYHNGAPVVTKLSMIFKETSLILRDDIDKGY